MKTTIRTQKNGSNRLQRGFTLIEISLVIALILGLIAVAFMGIGAYRKGSDKAKCKMQIAQLQKAVRSFQNMQDLKETSTFAAAGTTLFGATGIVPTTIACPSTGTLTFVDAFPALGTPVANCSLATAPYSHVLDTTAVTGETVDW